MKKADLSQLTTELIQENGLLGSALFHIGLFNIFYDTP